MLQPVDRHRVKPQCHVLRCALVLLAVAFAPTLAVADGLDGQPQGSLEQLWEDFYAKSAAELLEGFDAHSPNLQVVHRLRRLGDPIAIPHLEAAFVRADDKIVKQSIAAALSRIQPEGDYYLAYLTKSAEAAIESDDPFPVRIQSDGTASVAPEFEKWCERSRCDPKEAFDRSLARGSDIKHLARALNPRAIPLFIRGLQAKNFYAVLSSAEGLAALDYSPAIPAIAGASARISPPMRKAFARVLVYFSDPRAHELARSLAEDPAFIDALRAEAAKRGPEGVLGER